MEPTNQKSKTKPQSCKGGVSGSVFKKMLRDTEKFYSKYYSKKGGLEALLFDYVEFDFSIDFMPGDGFLLLDSDSSRVAPVEKCFEIIKKKGSITKEDMRYVSI